MSEKKNIERLFQEKFKDFEAIPEPKVWDNIEDALKKKKKRRVIPLWWRLSGVAAILLIGFMVGDGMINNSSKRTIEIVNENNPEKIDSKGGKNILPINKEESIASSDSEKNSSDENQVNSEETPTVNSSEKNNAGNNSVAIQETSANSKTKSSNYGSTNSRKNNLASHSKRSNNKAIASHSKVKNKTGKSNTAKQSSESIIPDESVASVYNSNKIIESENNSEDQIAQKTASEKETKNINSSKIAFDTSTFEKQKKDSAVIAAVEPNALEELLKEKEKQQTVTEAKLNRWQITSNVAPIYFSSASNGSPIDAQFAENQKTYEKNLSYGIGVNYALNEKWSVRGGVNKLTLGYNTNDIVYYPSLGTSARGINQSGYHAKGSTIIVENNTAINLVSFDNIQEKTPGHINQTMGYIEVPLEVSYKLLNQKFGIELVGGMSTMFLNENSLSVVSQGMQATLGKASNLNDVSFTSNIGIGFKYKFWKSFEANIEPKFKYQLNTFTDNAGGFKPYFIGLYSGINFNF